jgi:2',3'-cyclic-nucleotide 2'-phosphodiesterase (5'-nucleotidase family)
VSANLYDLRTRKPVYAPFVIKRFGRTKIAFIGATTPGTLYTETGAFYDGEEQVYDLREKEFFDVLQRTVNQARRKGAKYVIVLGHLGEDPDRSGVNSHLLAQRTTGIDLIFDGHTHSVIPHDTVLNAAGRPVVISETGTKLANIGKLLIRNGRFSNELLPRSTIHECNARVKATTDSIEALMRELTQRVVCHSDVRLRVFNDKGEQEVRLAETNLGDLVTDAYRIISGADISLANGGGIRTDKFAGDLTYGDIADILPYDNNLWIVEATGQRIIDLLQKNTSFIPVEDGSFPQVSGLRFTVHTADRTVSDVEVLNKETGAYEPIDPSRTYSVATIDYCVIGGGFYDMLKDCRVLHRGDVLYRDIFVQYLQHHLGGHISNDYAEPQGRIRIIKD